MFFKSKRQKIIETYCAMLNSTQMYGGVYGYLLRAGYTDDAQTFKNKYDEWRKVSPLLVKNSQRNDTCKIMDEFFNSATNNTNIIKEKMTIKLAKKEEQGLVHATRVIRDILSENP